MIANVLRWSAVLLTLIFILGCVTSGIPTEINNSDTTYISPANQDGIQDTVAVRLTIEIPERAALARYVISVVDSDEAPVRTDEVTVGIDVPLVALWDGRNDDGEFVPDGEYQLTVQVWDNDRNTGITGEHTVVVDNTPPTVEVTAQSLLFTPRGDGELEELRVSQRSSVEDRWIGTIRHADGGAAFVSVWNGVTEDFVWDGTSRDETPAPEGIYSYSIESTDFAGNTTTYRLDGIQLERAQRLASISLSRAGFSPNGDGRADGVMLEPSVSERNNLERWEIEVQSAGGESIWTHVDFEEPRGIRFDGFTADGDPARDGEYVAVLRTTYVGGQDPTAVSPAFTIDTIPPTATVEVDTLVFSPDGDGRLDSAEIRQTSSRESEWTGTFRNSLGVAVRSESWLGEVSTFAWDGTDGEGAPLADGIYEYALSAEDIGGNLAPPTIVRVRIDTRPTAVRILPSESRISPNGDGVKDSMVLSLIADVAEGIDNWIVTLNDSGGEPLGELARGTTQFPTQIPWDGQLDGELLPDGLYYPEVQASFASGRLSAALGPSVRVDTTSPRITVGYRPEFFSPDGDGNDDVLTITISAVDPSSFERWSVSITDQDDVLFAHWSESGRPPVALTWDGVSESGEVQAGDDYMVVVTATDSVGNSGEGETQFPIDILVTREGNRLRLSNIHFQPNTTTYQDLEDPVLASRNVETLDRIALVLGRYPQYSIRIEGHATHLLSFDPLRAQAEHFAVLVPLSFARAEAIREALVRRGIPRSRMTIFGHGGIKPIVPHDDEETRWQNRRVEFILDRR